MNLNANISSIRGGSVSADFNVGRGRQVGAPKKTFGQKFNDAAGVPQALDRVHAQLKSAVSPLQLTELLDEYALLVAMLARSRGGLQAVPGGRLLSAAIKAIDVS